MRWLRHGWPVLVWATAIWVFSTDRFSEVGTGHFILPVLRWLFPHASHHTIFILHFLIRKCAHLMEYFVFSLLVLEAIRGGRGGWNRKWGITAIAIAAVYAATDETHQLFVASRGASVVDVLIDTTGATLAQLAIAWWTSRRGGSDKDDPLAASIHDSGAPSSS
jgi:VanZ family protein